jgi:hypothetical protein
MNHENESINQHKNEIKNNEIKNNEIKNNEIKNNEMNNFDDIELEDVESYIVFDSDDDEDDDMILDYNLSQQGGKPTSKNPDSNETDGKKEEFDDEEEKEEREEDTELRDETMEAMKKNYSYPDQSDPNIQYKMNIKREFYYNRIPPRPEINDKTPG